MLAVNDPAASTFGTRVFMQTAKLILEVIDSNNMP